jgi:hypothetical protein
VARRKLEGYLSEGEHEDAIINGHKAEESMEDIYHMLRQRLGARHQLTLKAERAMKRVNEFRHIISNLGI